MADLPRQIGRYRLLERVGAGGMGEVFLAELVGAAGFRRRCAVKLVLPHRSARAGVATMFEREAMLASRIAHENVVQVFDYGKDADSLYLVMEFVDGLTLRALVERRSSQSSKGGGKPLAVADACALICDCARGLDVIHTQAGIVHRDVTPDNILVTREAIAKIGDFGIALAEGLERLTTTGELKGKVPYMAPEQLDGDDVTSAADVFALGVTLHFLLCGARPFDRATELATMNAIVNEAPPRVSAVRKGGDDVPAAVDALVARMLAKDAKERPSAKDVVAALEPHFRDRPRALLDAALGPPTRERATPLDTKVVRAPTGPADDTVVVPRDVPQKPIVITQPVPQPKTSPSSSSLSSPSSPSSSSEGPVSVASGEFVTFESESSAAMVAAFKPRRTPTAVAAGVVVGVAIVAIAGYTLWPAPSENVVDAGVATLVVAHDAGNANVVVGGDAGNTNPAVDVVVGGGGVGGGVEDAGSIDFTEPVGPAAHTSERVLELKGPSSVTWTTPDGKKLGTGNAKARVKASLHNVVAVDGQLGGRCNVVVTGGVARFDSVQTGGLDVRANPYAEVYAGARDLGTTPIRPPPQLPACTYRLRFVYEAKTKTSTVTLQPGKTTSVRVDME